MKKTPLLAAVLGATVIAALAGCTSSATTTADKTPKPTPTSSATTDAAAPVVNKCVDGQALLTGTATSNDLASGCDTVYVLMNDATIDLGPTKKLVFEGTGNKVTHTGEKPEIVGGEKNTVTAK
ncbi:hypothetical protein GCM10025867_04430 [Frondihabitans sucicola]|uniref:DUF3060 domain-containing protein n=1 Tax=Frondihabitans sucicola TaxID=1268041 RepID=A0ABM8GIJ3_9MICO|nr:hypothetical protein [Frondihabitans sucicola]BDZ48202.1 hypothetical protein GCM10025867_04430 [Frondihabitans sucicola]